MEDIRAEYIKSFCTGALMEPNVLVTEDRRNGWNAALLAVMSYFCEDEDNV